jgi:sigma-B regulation protein RsbU (phosphoserine phosphatase)
MLTTIEKIAILRSVNIFAQTPDDVLAEIAELLTPLEFQAGQTIVNKGDHGDCMYIIVSGQVRVHDGERTLSSLRAGQVFGEMALLDAEPRVASVTAAQDTSLFRLDQAPFYALMANRIEVARGIIGVLCQHVRGQVHNLAQDFEYMQRMSHITAAATALESGRYDPHSLDELCQRTDEVGQLARAFQQMTSGVQAREQLEIGRRIQKSFLPEKLLQPPGWEIAARFQPARQVSGDFYDVFSMVQNRRVGFVIADVCDKGVGAALFMALFRTLTRAFAQQHYRYSLRWEDTLIERRPFPNSPNERQWTGALTGSAALQNAIDFTNKYIAHVHGQTSMFATLFFGVLDPATGLLAYINAGHEPPVIVGSAGVKARLTPTGPIMGLFPDVTFEIHRAQFEPGDILVAFTDGVTEAHKPEGELFTTERVYELLATPAPTADALLGRIEASVHEHTAGAEQSDDITMLAVRRCPCN